MLKGLALLAVIVADVHVCYSRRASYVGIEAQRCKQ